NDSCENMIRLGSMLEDIEAAFCVGYRFESYGDSESEGGYFFDDDAPLFRPSSKTVDYSWDYIDVSASNSMKFGTGISLAYAHKNNFSWRLFCDYDYSRKTFTATYNPFVLMQGLSPDMVSFMDILGWDMTRPAVSSTKKSLNQWVLGCALCVSF
ncbi:MAG: hypothetical protein IK053_02015, partial [Muribaculaceae bacterium]|nr:hypothetical protein [Muribaculaceae bacterium]